MLFFAFGFLEWYEKPPQNDRQPYRAPLILMPATIEPVKNVHGARSLMISSTGEDLQENLSLKKKLAVDFGIDLPEFDEDESPDSYFSRIYQAVNRQDSWRIRRFVTLTLFTNLGKLLLYLDLDPDRWPDGGKPADHPIVRSLVGDGSGGQSAARPLSSESEIARKIDLDLCLVDRADATQAGVLLEALTGQNLVIQGPPGTGKSQTITNLIAAALDRGKTVLFVAEKLAALEVVKRRLREVGLGDFCLELHSHKTRKKALFEDLAARLSKHSPGMPGAFDSALAALRRRRAELDDYASAIRQPAGQTGLTVADLLFEAGRLRAANPALAQKIDQRGLSAQVGALIDPLSIDAFSAAATIQALKGAAQASQGLAPFGGPAGSPWRGVRAQFLAVQPLGGQHCLINWQNKARDAISAIAELNAWTGLNLVSRPSMFEELQLLADCSLDLPALLMLVVKVRTAWDELSREFDLRFDVGFDGLSQATRILDLMNSTPHAALLYAHQGLDTPSAEAALGRLEGVLQRRALLLANIKDSIANPDIDNVDTAALRAAGSLLKGAGLLTRLGREWRDARSLARSLQSAGMSKRPKEQGEALLALAERAAIDLDLEQDPDVQGACGEHFRGGKTDVAKLACALNWRREVRAKFGERRERDIRDMLLRSSPDDLIEIRDRIHRPVVDLMRHLSGADIGCSVDPQTDTWVAIARSVAPSVLAETLAGCKDEKCVADLMQRVRRAAVAAKALREAEKDAINVLSIDPVAWFGTAEEATAEDAAELANKSLEAPDALNPWLTYTQARTVALQSGGGPLLEAMEHGLVDPEEVEEAWRIAWLTDAAQRLYSAEPVLLRIQWAPTQ